MFDQAAQNITIQAQKEKYILRKHHPYFSLLIGLVVNSLFQK